MSVPGLATQLLSAVNTVAVTSCPVPLHHVEFCTPCPSKATRPCEQGHSSEPTLMESQPRDTSSRLVGDCWELGEEGLRGIFLTVLDLRKATQPYGGRCGEPQAVFPSPQAVGDPIRGCGFDPCGCLPFPQPRAPASPGAPVSLSYKSSIVPKSPEQGGTGQQLLDSRVEGTFLSLG